MDLPPDPSRLLNRYRQLRAAGRALNRVLADAIPAGAEIECGKLLGLVENDQLAFSSDNDAAVLIDFCIYHHRIDGRTLVDRYRAENPPDSDSDEWVLLDAMANAYYSLFNILDVRPDVGVRCHDILRREPVFVLDGHLSLTGEPNMILASQAMAPEGITMFTGAMLPVTQEAMDGIVEWLGTFDSLHVSQNPARLTPEQEDVLAAGIIRACLAGGSGGQIRFNEAVPPKPEDQDPSPPGE